MLKAMLNGVLQLKAQKKITRNTTAIEVDLDQDRNNSGKFPCERG